MRTIVRNSYEPKLRDYCNTIVVDEEQHVQYIFDSDGVFSKYISKDLEGAPTYYVDSAVNGAINTAKRYTDSSIATAKEYTDSKSAEVLEEAKQYTDEHGGGTGDVKKEYVDSRDAATLQEAKDFADAGDVATLGLANIQAETKIGAALAQANAYADSHIAQATADVPVFTIQASDPGEGTPLEANHFIAVYEGGE